MEKFFKTLHRTNLFSDFKSKLSGIKSGKVISILLVVLIIGTAFVYRGVSSGEGNPPDGQLEQEDAEGKAVTHAASIYVDIGGAVKKPMLAELPAGSRVEDAINAAGGLTDKADIATINRAEFLEDGEKILIPENSSESLTAASTEYSELATAGQSYVQTSPGGRVNINTADSQQLQTLNGVGPSTAQKIIDYRNSSGRFKTPEDIMNVSGIGEKTFEKLKNYITV